MPANAHVRDAPSPLSPVCGAFNELRCCWKPPPPPLLDGALSCVLKKPSADPMRPRCTIRRRLVARLQVNYHQQFGPLREGDEEPAPPRATTCHECGDELTGKMHFCSSCGARAQHDAVDIPKVRARAGSLSRKILLDNVFLALLLSFELRTGFREFSYWGSARAGSLLPNLSALSGVAVRLGVGDEQILSCGCI